MLTTKSGSTFSGIAFPLLTLLLSAVISCGGDTTVTPQPPADPVLDQPGGDTVPPAVVSKSPSAGATGVAVNAVITATFSEAVDITKFDATTFTVSNGSSLVAGTVVPNAWRTAATFTPHSNLAFNTLYTATITTGVRDDAGNAMLEPVSWSFTTAPGVGPSIRSVNPVLGSTGLCLNEFASARFNQKMDVASINESTFLMNGGAGTVSGSIYAYNTSTEGFAQFSPQSKLATFTTYTATLTTGIKDLTGTPMERDYQWGFRTTWTTQRGTTQDDEGRAVAVDASGNVFVAGALKHTQQLVSEFYLAKFNASAREQWYTTLISTRDSAAYGAATDASGNVFVVGASAGHVSGHTNRSEGSNDIVIAKFDAAGNKVWSIQKGTPSPDLAFGAALSSAATGTPYLYVTGTAGEEYTAPGTGLDGQPYSGVGGDYFLSKYTLNGSLVWTRQAGSAKDDSGNAVAVDGTGNIYIAGQIAEDSGYRDYFVAKYDPSGNRLWIAQHGTAVNDMAFGLSVDNEGNAYVAGYTDGSLEGVNQGKRDLFVAKYDASGTKQWLRQMGTQGDDEALGVALGTDGNVYVTGYTNSGSTGGLDGNISLGSAETFLIKYNTAGQKQWTKLLVGQGSDGGQGIAVDGANNIYVTGYASGGMCGNVGLGMKDIYVARFNAAGTLQ